MTAPNNPYAPGWVRNPALRVLIDGRPIPGALSAEWTATSHFSPDTWRASFAVNADPRYGMIWWDRLDVPAFVDLQVGAGAAGGIQWVSLGIGHVDDVEFHPEAGAVEISGRDLGALLIETETAEAFQNQTSSQIVQAVAARHGLTARVTATAPLSDRFYGTDFTRETHHHASRAMNEWDLLVRQAQVDCFDLFLDGRTLCYQPAPQLTDQPYLIAWNNKTAAAASPSSNAIGLRMHRSVMLAKPVSVVVKSFHSRKGAAIMATASSQGAVSGGSVGGSTFTTAAKKGRTYTFVLPNLTQPQADAKAKALLADITRHEREITWSEPASPVLTPRNVVRLSGTGTGFDQAFFVDRLTRRISFDGFTMDVTAKSVSAAQTQAVQNATTD